MTDLVKKKLEEVAEHYGNLAETLGPSAKAAGWRDEDTQYLRFKQLYEIIDTSSGDFTLADLGCGYGAFVDAMPEKIRSRMSRYDGYDISNKMVEAGKRAHEASPELHFIVGGKISREVDYCVESGIFNHHFGAARNEWTAHIHETLRHMVSMARKGVAFNIMSNRVDFQEDYIYYADPAEMLTFCLENFGRNVRLLHDYKLYEFTVLIRKGI